MPRYHNPDTATIRAIRLRNSRQGFVCIALIHLLKLSICRACPAPDRGIPVAVYRRHRPPYATPAANLQHCLYGIHILLHNPAVYAFDDAPPKYEAMLRNSLLSDLAPPRPALMGRACEPCASNPSRKHQWEPAQASSVHASSCQHAIHQVLSCGIPLSLPPHG